MTSTTEEGLSPFKPISCEWSPTPGAREAELLAQHRHAVAHAKRRLMFVAALLITLGFASGVVAAVLF